MKSVFDYAVDAVILALVLGLGLGLTALLFACAHWVWVQG